MPRRIVTVLAAAGTAALVSAGPAPGAVPAPGPDGRPDGRVTAQGPAGIRTAQPPAGAGRVPPAKPDSLRIVVRHSGVPHADGTHFLRCHPADGDHHDPEAACAVLDAAGRRGADPFAPGPADASCAMLYGGPATARVRGIWHGRPVDARFDRADACATSRWDRLVPLLPAVR